jgi:hypothetical protein
MRTIGSRNSFRGRIPHLCAAACALALLAATSLHAQKASLAFWEPPPTADAQFLHAPRHDADRYTTLRQAFVDAQCTAALMQEQPVGTHGDRNLICTLPGQTAGSILVAARYDGYTGAGFQPTWVDAYSLPMLDHALQAQPRHHTFIFAALIGENGEAAFFASLHASGKPLPSAMIVLDGLGWGSPLWYTVASVKAAPDHPADLGTNGLLGGIASGISRYLKIPEPTNLSPAQFTTEGGYSAAQDYRARRYESTLFRSAGSIPKLLLYTDLTNASTFGTTDLEIAHIRRDFDYAAWILCLADLKLDALPAPASPSAAADSNPH